MPGTPPHSPAAADTAARNRLAQDVMLRREEDHGAHCVRRVRRQIIDALTDAMVEPLFPGFVQRYDDDRCDGAVAEGTNVVGLVRGTAHPEILLTLASYYRPSQVTNAESGDITCTCGVGSACGIGAVLSAAHALALNPPRTSWLICLFDGDRPGLTGSRALARCSPIDFKRIALEINVDVMAGSERALSVKGAPQHPELAAHLAAIARRSATPIWLGDSISTARGSANPESHHSGPLLGSGAPWVHFGPATVSRTTSTSAAFSASASRTLRTAIRYFDERAVTFAHLRSKQN